MKKLLILGCNSDSCLSLLYKFTTGKSNAPEEHNENTGVIVQKKDANIDGKDVVIQLWHTLGQDKFDTIQRAYLRGINGIIFVYEASQSKTFKKIKKWTESMEEQNITCQFIIIGNTSELEEDVSEDEVTEFAKQHNAEHFKMNIRNCELDAINDAVMTLTRKII